MKSIKLFLITAGSVLVLSSCNNTGVTMDPAQQKASIDSLTQAYSLELKDSISKACEERMTSEVIAKSDSILKAATAEGKK